MSDFGLTFVGLLLLILIAGVVQQWPRIGRVLIVILAAWFAVALVVFFVRGDLFRSSGLDVDDAGGECGWAMVC